MIEIIEATTKKLQKQFVNFPLNLYKNNEYFVPPLYNDEMSIFTKKNVYYNTCDQVYYLAYKDNKVVGRISGILQKQHNEIKNEKRIRFTRFDAIDDVEVAKALFNSVEKWGKEKGMDTICGPLGFSDLEREGLLIEGFNELSTFEEQYNYAYYGKLIEACGYKKEVDWVEYKIYPPKNPDERLKKIVDVVLRRNKLHIVEIPKSKKEYINHYKDGFFDCLDECYKDLYGVVPFTEEMKKQMVDQFMMIVSKEFLIFVCDESDRVVGFGFTIPSISKAVQPSRGHLTLPCLLRIMKAVKKPTIGDLGLIAVRPEYQKKGVNAVFLSKMQESLQKFNLDHFETNLNLEDNLAVQTQWEQFEHVQHKRRRSYVKKIII